MRKGMTNEEAIKFLKQLYPYGGHCWLDEQRIEAIGMAIDVLKEASVSEDLEQAIDTYLATYFGGEQEKQEWPFMKKMAIHFAEWQKQKDANLIFNAKEDGYMLGLATMKQQLMAKAVDATVHIDAGGYPYIPQMELYDYEKDIPLAKEGEKVKVIVINE